MTPAHQFTLAESGGGWVIECECGWVDWEETEKEALKAYQAHLEVQW